ncbi:hypothetical protein PY254_05400 [Rhodanobacter sp. AS-Z3]|uniref:DUF6600 domain-containing protein n=1 Tax=Rhodanobacter sp. AS-Z3 TaxID=3031330 RepID=UPI002479D7E9|nr:DUF6600 domain-containing protein [Rhodanobacter sp. AS-Z3]WEN16108.1 hypothetical protein PY254_05400 [Rhodanobacter sp. AS-Z3]
MPRFAEFSVSWRQHWRVFAMLLLCLFAGLVQAQSDADDSADPPTRVARLSYIGGDLGFLPAGAKDWSDARINRPLTNGDKLSSAAGARAELEFGGGTLHIDGKTDLGLLDLNEQIAQLELTQGSLSISVRQLGDGESYEIDTPAVALVIDQPGTFRVDVDPRDGSTRVSALDGAATVFGENNAQRSINPGRSYRFSDSSLSMVTISGINRGDAFDRWASERDNRYAESNSRQYVSDDVVGYQDLDQYGGWQDGSEYGAVWYPRNVGSNWAPYRNGHWAYIAPWGWTWVDDAPWGYAPYHYGRWAYTQRGWGWIPGPRGARAIYAPALVAFVGGGGWSVGIGGTPVGWFPLGPGEIYNPWYHVGRRYYTSVNINIYNGRSSRGHDPRHDFDDHYNRYRRGDFDRDNHYANRQAPRGFTAVSSRSFGDGHNVQQNLVHVDPRKLADAPVRSRTIDQLRPSDRGDQSASSRHVRNLPAGGFNREVVARRAPPDNHANAMPARSNRPGDYSRGSVRVLEPDEASAQSSPSNRNDGNMRHPSDARLPVVPTITPAGRSGREEMTHDDGELRSSRFARPRSGNDIERRAPMPRSDANVITASPRESSANDSPPAPYNRERYQRAWQPSPAMPAARTVAEPQRFERPQPQSRVERPEPRSVEQPSWRATPPAATHEYSREIAAPPRQSTPAPQNYQPPQRMMPPPRAETPRPQQSTPRPENGKDVERKKRFEHQD